MLLIYLANVLNQIENYMNKCNYEQTRVYIHYGIRYSMNQKEVRDLIKELREIESIVDFRPARAKERLDQVILVLRSMITS